MTSIADSLQIDMKQIEKEGAMHIAPDDIISQAAQIGGVPTVSSLLSSTTT